MTTDAIDYTQYLPTELLRHIADLAGCSLALEATSRMWRNIVQSLRHKHPWTPERSLGDTWEEAQWNHPDDGNHKEMRLLAAAKHGILDEISKVSDFSHFWCSPRLYMPTFPMINRFRGSEIQFILSQIAVAYKHMRIIEHLNTCDFDYGDWSRAVAAVSQPDPRVLEWFISWYTFNIGEALVAPAKKNDFESIVMIINMVRSYDLEHGVRTTEHEITNALLAAITVAISCNSHRVIEGIVKLNTPSNECFVYMDTTQFTVNYMYPTYDAFDRARLSIATALHNGNTQLATRIYDPHGFSDTDTDTDINFISSIASNFNRIAYLEKEEFGYLAACDRSMDVLGWILDRQPAFSLEDLCDRIDFATEQHVKAFDILGTAMGTSRTRLAHLHAVQNNPVLMQLYLDDGRLHRSDIRVSLVQSTPTIEWILDNDMSDPSEAAREFVLSTDLDGIAMMVRKGYRSEIDAILKTRLYPRKCITRMLASM